MPTKNSPLNSFIGHGPKKGFTLVEVLMGIVLGSILLLAGWKMMQAAGDQNKQLRSLSELATSALDIDATLSTDVQEAGRGLFTMPNVGPINVQFSDLPSDTLDALIILKPPTMDGQENPDTTVWRVSAEACASGSPANCLLLVGNATGTLAPNQLMIVGSPTLGGHVISIVSSSIVNQPCVLDCNRDFEQDASTYLSTPATYVDGGAPWTCTVSNCIDVKNTPAAAQCTGAAGQTAATAATSTAVAQSIYSPTPAVSCTPGVIRPSTANTGVYGQASVTPSSATFTRVIYNIQTASLGYPQIPTGVLRSGSGNLPISYAQRVVAFRYYIDTDQTRYRTPTLVRQSGWMPGGAFNINAPVVPNAKSLVVEVRHTPTQASPSDAADDPNYVRQVIATSEALTMASTNLDAGNPPCTSGNNWRREASPSDSIRLKGWRFCQSYATITGVRLRYRTVAAYRLDAQSADSTFRVYNTVVATPNITQGGAVVSP